jgi:hypothetical protein
VNHKAEARKNLNRREDKWGIKVEEESNDGRKQI